MKLLRHYSHTSDAEDAARKLESKGILTHVTAKYSQRLSRHMTGALKAGLWILIDDQYEDAREFLNNPRHKITTGIAPKEIQRMRELAKPRVFEALNTAIVYGGILAIIMLFIFLRKLWQT